MSLSPPLRRLSSAGSSSKESLINAYEAEEERIINVLSRKLEKLREEKIELENVLEAESEAHVNRLSRELSALRMAQQQQSQVQVNGSGSVSPVDIRGSSSPAAPSNETMLEALRRENEQLRGRLVDTERDYIRISRLNEIYREELIDHRRRLGLAVDNLIGLAPYDPYSQPTHRRAQSTSSSVSTSPYLSPSHPQSNTSHTVSARVPIPRPPSQIRRPHTHFTSTSTTPPSSSSASASLPSPFPFSPPGVGMSNTTSFTTPPSSGSLAAMNQATITNPHELTYPSVPPPSLSSSFGEPQTLAADVVDLNHHQLNGLNGLNGINEVDDIPLPPPVPIPRAHPRAEMDYSLSPTDGTFSRGSSTGVSPRRSFHIPRRGSFERAAGRVASGMFFGESPGSSAWMIDDEFRSPSRSRSRVGSISSVERGARIAETGRLIPRNRLDNTEGHGVDLGLSQGVNEGMLNGRINGARMNGHHGHA